MRDAGSIPEGWSFNPSAPLHRLFTAAFAAAGFGIALYLTLYEFGWIHSVWDPLFDSRAVLDSKVAHLFPIPDALIGAGLYLVDLVLVLSGGSRRWKDRPRLTLLSGGVAAALGFSAVVLMIIQPVAIGAWCLLCLGSALTSLIILQRSIAESVAAAQWIFLRREAPPRLQPSRHPVSSGVEFHWHLNLCLALGIFTLFLPRIFSIQGVGAASISIAGVLAISSSLIAMAEVARPVRLLNGAAAALLFCWFLGEPFGTDRWIAALVALVLSGLCLYRGPIFNSYG